MCAGFIEQVRVAVKDRLHKPFENIDWSLEWDQDQTQSKQGVKSTAYNYIVQNFLGKNMSLGAFSEAQTVENLNLEFNRISTEVANGIEKFVVGKMQDVLKDIQKQEKELLAKPAELLTEDMEKYLQKIAEVNIITRKSYSYVDPAAIQDSVQQLGNVQQEAIKIAHKLQWIRTKFDPQDFNLTLQKYDAKMDLVRKQLKQVQELFESKSQSQIKFMSEEQITLDLENLMIALVESKKEMNDEATMEQRMRLLVSSIQALTENALQLAETAQEKILKKIFYAITETIKRPTYNRNPLWRTLKYIEYWKNLKNTSTENRRALPTLQLQTINQQLILIQNKYGMGKMSKTLTINPKLDPPTWVTNICEALIQTIIAFTSMLQCDITDEEIRMWIKKVFKQPTEESTYFSRKRKKISEEEKEINYRNEKVYALQRQVEEKLQRQKKDKQPQAQLKE